MLHLHYANRLENLLEPLAAAVDLHQHGDPLAPLAIVVPNRAVEQFAKHAIAERLGVAANLDFPFLRRYLAEVVERAESSLRVLEVARLQVVLFECLRSDSHRADAAFQPVRDYVASGDPSSGRIADLRMFELAGRVARLFQEYSISRDEMLQSWRSAGTKEASLRPEERWQKRLWTAAFDREFAALPAWTHDRDHRWMLLVHALAALSDDRLRSALPPALHVFGLASPGRAFLRIFARLGALRDLHVYALNPCMEFWEDVDTSAAARRDAWRRRSERIGDAFEDREDPFGLAARSDNRALQLWGRPGREYIRMLNELTDCDFHPHFSHPPRTSLLSRLQDDILIRAVEGSGEGAGDEEPSPPSIRFIGAPGLRREIEIVASEILRVVAGGDGDEKRAPVRFHEVAVLVPENTSDSYLPHLEAIFESQFGIPVEIVGRRAAVSPAAEAIGLLLKFPLGRAGRDETLRLLAHPATGASGPEAGIDRLNAWCEELGVFFGADASDLANTYVPPNLFQWDQALTRLTLGAFMEGDSRGEASLYAGEAGDVLPLGLSQDEIPGAARFIQDARALLADAHAIRSHTLPLSEWAAVVAELIGRYIRTPDPADQVVRDRFLETLESISSVQSGPVGYEVAYSLISASLPDLSGYQGGFSGRGVAAGSIASLRGLPFRAIFVMGLNEAVFPERETRDPIDLRLARRFPGDISPAERDRYLFLEALVCAREQIAFSWVERDAQTGDRLFPATTIRELESILTAYADDRTVRGLTTSHPVSRYDPAYFPDLNSDRNSDAGRDLVSFDPDARRGARMLAIRDHLARSAGEAAIPPRDEFLRRIDSRVRARLAPSLGLFDLPAGAGSASGEIDLPVAAIRRFLECPLQGAARYALGMADDNAAEEEALDEPIVQSRMGHARVLRDAFWAARGDPDTFKAAYREALEIAQMKGLAPAGPFADAALAADCARFARWCAAMGDAREDLDRWRVFRIGRGDEFSRADKLLPALPLDVPVVDNAGRPTIRRVNLHGSLGAFSPSLDCSIRLVARKRPKPRDFLEPFIAALLLNAAGEPVPRVFNALVLGDPAGTAKDTGAWSRTLRMPSPEAAREYLAALIGEMMAGAHDYFLPIEAVAAAREALTAGKDAIAAIDQTRENPISSCASDFGPVRNARDYEPPDETEIEGIIERRFGLVAAIFDDGGDA